MDDDAARERAKVKVQDKRRAARGASQPAAAANAAPEPGSNAAIAPDAAAPEAATGARAAPASEGSATASAEPGAPTPENVGVPGGEADVAPDYLDDLRRLQAEFDNYRKRMMREQAQVTERATAGLVERLLPVVDSFERALSHGDVSDGVRLVHRELVKVLTGAGLDEIEAEGRPFDPTVHEAVESREDADVDEVTCATVYRRGYRFAGRVLRPAMVGVVRPAEEPPGDDAGEPLEAGGGA